MTSPPSPSGVNTPVPRAVEEALEQIVPGEPVEAITPIEHGNRSETALVDRTGQPPVVVQLTSDPDAVTTEAVVLNAVADRTAVPVPSPLATATLDDNGVLVTEYVAGSNLHSKFVEHSIAEQRSLVRSFGQCLAALHSAFTFDGCGPVTAVDGQLTAAGQSPAEWQRAYGAAAFDRLPEPFEDLIEPLRSLLCGGQFSADGADVTLFPWDFRPGNALVRDGELAAVLDWEEPLAAPAAVSAAKARYLVADWYVEDTEPLRDAFRAGYESVRPFPALTPADRAVAIADTAVDSRGVVTNPRYPALDYEDSVTVHRSALQAVLDDT